MTSNEQKEEWLLRDNPQRFVLFPIMHPDLWEMKTKAEDSMWKSDEIDLSNDMVHWEKLTDGERHFIKHVLAFFSSSDGLVNENLCANFSVEITNPESRAFFTFQMAIETVHNQTYSTLIDTYVRDPDEKHRLFTAIQCMPTISKKANWALKYCSREYASFAERLLAFLIMEGLFFSSSFASIYYMRKRGLLPGLAQANDLIARDESLHCQFSAMLYNKLENKLPTERVMQIIKEATEIECEFVSEALPVALLGINTDLMCIYVRHVSNVIMGMIGYPKPYPEAYCCFDFMEMISISSKGNFFERRETNYFLPSLVRSFSTDDDF
jgi:ribonucleotide reductase beta subunit family protein with ferritin-like domain